MSILTSTISSLGNALPSTRAGRLLILIYHRVHPEPDPMFVGEVDAERFNRQMALLRRHCHPVSLAAGVQGVAAGTLPDRAVAVTFDDGYADNATVALPILQRNEVPATFFVATGFLDGGRMWNDSIIESVRRADVAELDLSNVGLGVVQLGPLTSRGPVAEKVLQKIKHLPPLERAAKVAELCEQVGVALPSNLMMSTGQVRLLARNGMEIGAHTVSHPILRTLSADAAAAEIRESKSALEAMTGRPVRAFAYPNGRPGDDYTERDRDIVRNLGFDCALSTWWGVAADVSDRFQLPRFSPWDRQPHLWLGRLLVAFSKPAVLSR